MCGSMTCTVRGVLELAVTDSWWRTLLEGALGEVIGGLVTVGALLGGFAWERRQARERDVLEECRRLINGVRSLQIAQDPLRGRPQDEDERSRRIWSRIMDVKPWRHDMDALASRLQAAEPCTAALLRASGGATEWWYTGGKIVSDPDGQEYYQRETTEEMCATANAIAILTKRLHQPALVTSMTAIRCQQLEAKVQQSTEFLAEVDWTG